MILFLVDLPKPMHGMSNINMQMLQRCQLEGIDSVVINTVPSYAAKLFGTRGWALAKFVHSVAIWFRLLFCLLWQKPKVVYRSLNGGGGQIYDLLYLILLRFSKAQVILHHHSFSYLNQYSGLFQNVCGLLKSQDRHIVLGESMQRELVRLYALSEEKILVISNLSFFEQTTSSAQVIVKLENKPLQVSHLANLSFEKGVKFFIETVIALRQLGVPLQARLAGPCSTPEVFQYVNKACLDYEFIQYLGPLYAEAKTSFFQETDLFIFPSRYVNEAEPLVLYEAAQFGAFLSGTPRGCMADQISRFEGYCYSEQTLPMEVAENLKSLADSQAFSLSAKERRLGLFSNEQNMASSTLGSFIRQLKAEYVPEFKEI